MAFSHGFGEMWHSDMISAFLPPFHANARIFRFHISLKSSILSQCSSPEVAAAPQGPHGGSRARSGRVAPENSPICTKRGDFFLQDFRVIIKDIVLKNSD